MPHKIAALEELARHTIGDGGREHLYFVTDRGIVVTVTRDRDIALQHWRTLAARRPLQECALEDRAYGVLASVEPEGDEPGSPLCISSAI